MRAIVSLVLTGAVLGSLALPTQAQTQTNAAGARGGGGGGRRGGGGQNPPARTLPLAADALESVTWRTRTHVGIDEMTNWKFGIAAGSIGNLTFRDAVVRADAARVDYIEGNSSQKVSPEISKNLGPNLDSNEVATARSFLSGGPRMLAYRTDNIGDDAGARRKLFEFAKAMGVHTIVAPLKADAIADLEKLADEFSINVAFNGKPDVVMQALDGHGKRLGIAGDTGTWMEYNSAPLDTLKVVKDKLIYISLRDRSAMGNNAQNVLLGKGVGKLTEFFNELNRLKVRPLILSLDTTGLIKAPGDIFTAVNAFEDTVQPAYGAYFTEWSKKHEPPRLNLDERSRTVGAGTNRMQMPDDQIRQKMADAVKTVSVVKPKKARKLLVVESLHGMYHNPGIPNCNVLLDMLGKSTGAWETEFSNDLDNLKYPAIKKYDAVFINSAVNEMFPDPLVREGLARFVKEGGGLGGIHGTPWASRNWQEFADMIGSRSADHRIEDGVMKVYDPASPLVKSFAGKDLSFKEEYYRFDQTGYNRLMWENVRVVLTVETQTRQSNAWLGNNYPVTWVRSYGKGRTFYCSLGHMAETFMQPEIVGHLCAGMQFLLGDLEIDTTPNPPKVATTP